MTTAQPVILLHSSGSSGAQWRALSAQLSPRYRVVAPDLYGYGSTAPWPGNGAFSLAHEAELVLALLDQVGSPVHLVGHSYGGAVALRVARAHADRVRSLAVYEPVAFHLLADRSEITALAQDVARAVACGDYIGGFASFFDYWSGAGSWDAIPPAKRAAMAARLPKVALEFHAALTEPAHLADFEALAVPTMLLQGARSPRPTRRICELLAHVMPDARLITLNDAGHMAPLTHPDQVNALIAAHLNSSGGRNETRLDRLADSHRRLRQHAAGAG
jgi:pimeloyl-ACP methyl ester carboxylesterase